MIRTPFIVAALALAGCTSSKLKTVCSSADQCPACPAGFTPICRSGGCGCSCNGDSACSVNEFCNAGGYCQVRVGCDSNADCPKDEICDTTTHQCIGQEHCTKDIQCPLGQVCSLDSFQCQAGCASNGDCALGQVCRACDSSSASCPTGKSCKLGPCDDQSICPLGFVCAPSDATDPKSEKTCQKDTRGPFCTVCTEQPGSSAYCPGTPADFCLIDSTKNFGSYFCGVDCSSPGPSECPNGFACQDVQILTQNPCTMDGDCHPTGTNPACQTDADCGLTAAGLAAPGRCDLGTHRCAPFCVGAGEGTVQAYCSCVQDSDCPNDACVGGNCQITGKPCTNLPDAMGNPVDTCREHPIYCVKYPDKHFGTLGFCRVGKNCAPVEGVTCDDVRNQKVP